MKIDFLADTNFFIYLHEGNKIVSPFLEYNFGISFISEIELLSYSNLTKTEEAKLRQLIKDCFYLDWNSNIKEQTIQLKRNSTIKLPDAVIAATAIVYNIPLVTGDRMFSKIKGLEVMLIDVKE